MNIGPPPANALRGIKQVPIAIINRINYSLMNLDYERIGSHYRHRVSWKDSARASKLRQTQPLAVAPSEWAVLRVGVRLRLAHRGEWLVQAITSSLHVAYHSKNRHWPGVLKGIHADRAAVLAAFVIGSQRKAEGLPRNLREVGKDHTIFLNPWQPVRPVRIYAGMPTTTELLPTLNADVLKALARQLGLAKTVTRKPELIAELDCYVRENLPNLLAHCSVTEKQLLAEAAHNKGRVDPTAFRAKYGVACPLPENPHWASTKTPLFLLLDYQYEMWNMPPSIAERLRALLEKPAKVTIEVVDTLPANYTPPEERWRKPEARPIHIHEGERIVFAELRSVLKLVQAGKVRVTDKGGRPTENAVQLISEVLVVPDFLVDEPPEDTDEYTEPGGVVRAHAWGVLVQQCGWARAKGGRLAMTSEGQTLLASVDASKFLAGVQAFLRDDAFDELNRINHIRGQSGGGKRYLTPPADRRRKISKSVARWPVNQWIAFDEADRFLRATGHHFWVSNADYTLYFGELQYGSLGDQGGQINRQYLRAFLLMCTPLAKSFTVRIPDLT